MKTGIINRKYALFDQRMRLLLFFLFAAWIPSILAIESKTKNTDLVSNDSMFRNLISTGVCGDGKKPFMHYFEVNVYIEPATFQICPIADQIRLGLDIDFILATAVCSRKEINSKREIEKEFIVHLISFFILFLFKNITIK